jgi:hypothetical protein
MSSPMGRILLRNGNRDEPYWTHCGSSWSRPSCKALLKNELFPNRRFLFKCARGSYNAEALQKLKVGQAYVKTPPLDAAVFVNMPREPLGNLPKLPTTIGDLKKRSKANFGAIGKPSVLMSVDTETQNEEVAELPDTETPTPKAKPKTTRGRRRTRFDDDKGDPLIEIEVI